MDQQREIGWIEVSAAKYAADATPTDADIEAYYDAHKSAYMTPETVNLHYLEISLAKLAANVTVTDAQLHAYFEDQKKKNPEAYVQPEERRVSHILITATDPKDLAAAKAKAESIFKRAQAGEDFAKLAKEYSQDPGSAKQGGDLGWSEAKDWVKPFADAAFAMKVGEIRGPVQTQFGYHILKLEGIRPATVKTFDQSKNDLAAEYKRNEADKQFNDLQDKLADAALQNPTDIDAAGRKAGLPVQEIKDFSRTQGGAPFGASKPLIDAAFSADALDGNLSSIVEVTKGDGLVLRSTDHKMPQQRPLADVRADVIAAWKRQRGTELAFAAAQDAKKQLEGGAAWADVAKSLSVTPDLPRWVSREDQSVPITIRRMAFESPKPAAKPVYDALALERRRRRGVRPRRGPAESERAGCERSDAAPGTGDAVRCRRVAELCERRAQRRCGRGQSESHRLIGRAHPPVFRVVPGRAQPRRLLADRRADDPGEHARAHPQRSHHSAGGLSCAHAGTVVGRRHRRRGHGRLLARRLDHVRPYRAGSAARSCCVSAPISASPSRRSNWPSAGPRTTAWPESSFRASCRSSAT